jgi:hypothetical protein
MTELKSPVDILKLLNKSNCRECGLATCLAFAAAVFKGQKQLGECPYLPDEIVAAMGGQTEKRKTVEEDMTETVEQLKQAVAQMDLAEAAPRIGAEYVHDKLIIKVLGKNFGVDARGNLSADIHMHPWVTIPILSYIINCQGKPVSGQWVPMRELKKGAAWYPLFAQRCEKPLKKVADAYPDLFRDLLHIFNGKQVEKHYDSDISLVLHPLPKIPILICYWHPEDGLESNLNIFFDAHADDNLGLESIYALGAGLVRMFEKIAVTHNFQ